MGPSGTYNPLLAVADSDGLGEVGGVRTGGTTLDRNSHRVDLWLLCFRGKRHTPICALFLMII